MAQCASETGGFTIVRESLTYTSAERLRTVWPARFRNKSDAELAHLVRNPVALGDAVYMGRMGNTAPGDGYAYRGGGFLQTTGRFNVEKYCKQCGIGGDGRSPGVVR
jgi:putative chitinase